MKVYVCDPKSLLKQLASHPGLLKVFLLWIIKLSRLQISTSSSTKRTWNYHKSRSYIQHYNKNYNKIKDSHSSWNVSAFVDIDHPEDSLDVHFRNLSLKSKQVKSHWLTVNDMFQFLSSDLKWCVLKCLSVDSEIAVHENLFWLNLSPPSLLQVGHHHLMIRHSDYHHHHHDHRHHLIIIGPCAVLRLRKWIIKP